MDDTRPATGPQRIGRYEIVRLLGRGGMGTVYLARDPLIDRLVAIKVLAPGFDARARERFTREARAAGRLQHENIATIFDVGEQGDEPFIAMEYVPGETLGALIRRPVRLDLTETLRILEQACAGLAFAHRAGIVHLDVKPENMIRREDGRVKILDFGISRVLEGEQTQTRHLLGTLRYMSPEQLKGEAIDARTDVFALGCVLYEVVARKPAFTGNLTEIAARIDGRDVTPLAELVPGVHPELVRMARRAMAHDPADRYDDLDTLRHELLALRRQFDSVADEATVGWRTPVSASTAPATAAASGPGAPLLHHQAPASAQVTSPGGRRWLGWVAVLALVAAVAAGIVWRGRVYGGGTDAIQATGTTSGRPVATMASSDRPADGAVAGPAATPPGRNASADEAEAREALRGADRATTLKLLRERPYLAVKLIDELTSVARLAAEESRRIAGAQASTSKTYRAGIDALERARTLESGGQRIESLAAFWEASDLFVRAATPAPSPGQRATLPPERPFPPAPTAADSSATAGTKPELTSGGSALPPPAGDSVAGVPAPLSIAPAPDRPTDPSPEPPAAKELPKPSSPPLDNRNLAPPEDAVRAVLFTYAAAYELRDISAVRRVFPSLPAAQAKAQADTFASAASYRLRIRVLDVQVTGPTAVAACEVAHEFVPKVGSPSANVQQSRFYLRQSDGTWLIERVESATRR